jgi:hypothetical protein
MDLLQVHRDLSASSRAIIKAKNQDYSGGGDPFANFRTATLLGVHPVAGLAMRCGDKFMRIKSYLVKGKLEVVGEGVIDAIDDCYNYVVLAAGLLATTRNLGDVRAPATTAEIITLHEKLSELAEAEYAFVDIDNVLKAGEVYGVDRIRSGLIDCTELFQRILRPMAAIDYTPYILALLAKVVTLKAMLLIRVKSAENDQLVANMHETHKPVPIVQLTPAASAPVAPPAPPVV